MLTNDVSQLTNGDALPANVVTVPLTNVDPMLANGGAMLSNTDSLPN